MNSKNIDMFLCIQNIRVFENLDVKEINNRRIQGLKKLNIKEFRKENNEI